MDRGAASEDEPWVSAGIDRESYDHLVTEFVTLDGDQNNMLSRKEFDNLSGLPEFLSLTHDDIDHVFAVVDVDHSDSITLQEFVAYMAKRKDHQPLPVQVQSQMSRLELTVQRLGFALCTTDGGQHGVSGDGNCQFYSLSWHLMKTTAQAGPVRKQIVSYLRGPAGEEFSAFYAPTHPRQPSTFDAYLDDMSKDRVWGDHLTLQAAANRFNLEVRLITADLSTGGGDQSNLCLSSGKSDAKVIWMSFAAQHYSPVVPSSDTPEALLK